MQCPYAVGQETGKSIQCQTLQKNNAKWGFCIHQYFCRAIGKYALNNEAAQCKIRKGSE